MNFEETCLQNLDSYLVQVASSWQFEVDDIEYIVGLNKAVASRLKELLGNRVQAIVMPSFLYDLDGECKAAVVSMHKHCTVGSEAHRVADLTMQLIQPHIDDHELTLFMHTIALPGAWGDQPTKCIDRYKFRSRYARECGVLVPLEMPTLADCRETPQAQKPPGFGMTFEQIAEGIDVSVCQEDE